MTTYFVPRTGSTLTSEGSRYPRELVREVPHRDADTLRDSLACGDYCLVVGLLLLEKRGRLRKRHPHIQLGDRDFDTESSEFAHVFFQGRGNLSDDEVRLETDTVEGNVRGLEALDEILHGSRLCAWALDVVVVDVELGVWVGKVRGMQRERDVGGVEGVVPDRLAPGAVVVEWFYICLSVPIDSDAHNCERTVDDIPTVCRFSRELSNRMK